LAAARQLRGVDWLEVAASDVITSCCRCKGAAAWEALFAACYTGRRPLRLRQIWCKSVYGGLLGKWVKYKNCFYLYIFFINSPTGQTRRRIFTIDGSNDANSRKDVPFGGFVDIAPNFRGEIPRKRQFLGHE